MSGLILLSLYGSVNVVSALIPAGCIPSSSLHHSIVNGAAKIRAVGLFRPRVLHLESEAHDDDIIRLLGGDNVTLHRPGEVRYQGPMRRCRRARAASSDNNAFHISPTVRNMTDTCDVQAGAFSAIEIDVIDLVH